MGGHGGAEGGEVAHGGEGAVDWLDAGAELEGDWKGGSLRLHGEGEG